MKPGYWNPPQELNALEKNIVKRIKRAKLFTFLREIRHQLFNDEFQEELNTIYAEANKGKPPVPPAKLALVIILQAYTGASDAEAIEALIMDRRWQLVLDCLDCEQAPFSQATLVRFRNALIIQSLDRRLIERTVELAEKTKGFGSRQLRAALDSSPLWGASKVEDTYNLMGHALKKVIGVISNQQGRGLMEIAQEIGVDIIVGSSLKAALDLNWDDPEQKTVALNIVLEALEKVETYVQAQPKETEHPVIDYCLETAREIEVQDVEIDEHGKKKLRSGVAKERRISIEDEEMRHGRKSRSQKIDGYKRHVLRDLDNGLIRAVGITKANAPEASVTKSIEEDLKKQNIEMTELHIDRGYLSSELVKNRPLGLTIYCKAWPVQNGTKFSKNEFILDWDNGTISCPNQVTLPFTVGGKVQFPQAVCATCPLKESCTTSPRGRSISIHPEEELFRELRERQLTSIGRAKLRERVSVEHSLSYWSLARSTGSLCWFSQKLI
jgi:transposase